MIVVLIYLSVLALGTAVFLFGDPRQNTILGIINRTFTRTIPSGLSTVVRKFPGGAAFVDSLDALRVWVVYKPNPLMQLFYLLLIVGGYVVFLIQAFPLIPNVVLPWYHAYTCHAAVAAVLYTFYKACTVSPGVLTSDTLKKHDHYEYDGFLYTSARTCRTCHVRKLARSKHCAVCDVCVSRFDHHCPWLNQCVGENNYRHFLIFLFGNAVFLTYASYVLAGCLVAASIQERLWHMRFTNKSTGVVSGPTVPIVLQYMMSTHGMLMMLLLLAVIMAVVLFGFWGYHIHLASKNTTTNESEKLSGVADYYAYIATHAPPPHIAEEVRVAREELIAKKVDLLAPNYPRALEKRNDEEFPAKIPAHIYAYPSFASNLMQVWRPRSENGEYELAPIERMRRDKYASSGSTTTTSKRKKKKK